MRDRAATLVQGHRERLARAVGRPLAEPRADESVLEPADRSHMLEDARDLYWNELEWEHITEEEATDGPPLSELAFPGLLAFVRGLLLTETNPDALAPAAPRPQVVADLLDFLAGRVLELEEALAAPPIEEEGRTRGELMMTDRLLDLVLYRYHGLTSDDVERVEAARPG